MWIFAVEGFVSVVALKGTKDRLLVRGRVRQDVAHWAKLTGERRVRETPLADYRWRYVTTRKRLAAALSKMMLKGIAYTNFKSAVGHDDPERARAYIEVWSAMARLQEQKRAR